MCAYLKNIGGYKYNQLKGRSYEEIQKLFDKAYKQLESDKSKKQKINEHVKAEKDNDQEEAEMKMHIEIVKYDENINREDLETLWKLVKAKHGNTRPQEDYERVLWGDLKHEKSQWKCLTASPVMVRLLIKKLEIRSRTSSFGVELLGLKVFKNDS
ncbi:hypothetical protein Tco_1309957 [Tanacetum coccineum]